MNNNTGFTPPPMTANTSSGGDYSFLIPAKQHAARCVWLIDAGTIDDTFEGKVSKKNHVIIGFELPRLPLPETHPRAGEPAFKSQQFVNVLSKNKLGKPSKFLDFLNRWRGQEIPESDYATFDTGKLLGAPAMLTFAHNTKDGVVYSNMDSICSVMQYKQSLADGLGKSINEIEFAVPPQVNKSIYFSVKWLFMDGGAQHCMSVFNDLPEWIQKRIMASDEWKAYTLTPGYIAPPARTQQAQSPAPAPQQPQAQQAQPQPQAQHPMGAYQQAPPVIQQPTAGGGQPPVTQGGGDDFDDSELPF
jgi:hypothetical protein